MLCFLRRRGDPFGVLEPGGKQITTYDWRDLKAAIEGRRWRGTRNRTQTGVSHFRPEKLRGAEHMFDGGIRSGPIAPRRIGQ